MAGNAIADYVNYLRQSKNQQTKDWALIEHFEAAERVVRDRFLEGVDGLQPLRGTGVGRIDDDPLLQASQQKLLALIRTYYFEEKPLNRDNAAAFFRELLALRESFV